MFKLEIPDWPLFNRDKAISKMQKEITIAVDNMTNMAQNNIIMESPKASGQLANHIQSERVNELSGRVFVNVDYGVVVEKGRRPNQTPPPYKPLMRWIKGSRQGQSWFNQVKQNFKNIKIIGAAIMLAKSIGRKGFEKNPFFHRGVEKSKEYFNYETNDLIGKIKEGLTS